MSRRGRAGSRWGAFWRDEDETHELASAPKHHLADPALAASLLGLGVGALLQGDQGPVPIPRDGTFLATVDDDDITHLRWLRDELRDDLFDAVVVTTGPHAYRRPDGIQMMPSRRSWLAA